MFYQQILQCSHGPTGKTCIICKFAQKRYREHTIQVEKDRRKREAEQIEQLSAQRRGFVCQHVLPRYPENWVWSVEEDLVPTCIISFSESAADALQACSRQLLKIPQHEDRIKHLQDLFKQSGHAFDHHHKLLRSGEKAILTLQRHVRGVISRRSAYALQLELMETYGSSYWDYPPKMKIMSNDRPVSPTTLNRKIRNFHSKRERRLKKWQDIQETEMEKLKKHLRDEWRLVHMREFHQAIAQAFMQLNRAMDSTSLLECEKEVRSNLWWPGTETESVHMSKAIQAVLEDGRSAENDWNWSGETWDNEALQRFKTKLSEIYTAGNIEEVLAQVLVSPSCVQGLAAASAMNSDPTAWLYPLPTAMFPARLTMQRRYQFLDHAFKFRMFLYRGLLVGLSQLEDLIFYPETFESRNDVLGASMQFYVKCSQQLSALGKNPYSGLEKKGGKMGASSTASSPASIETPGIPTFASLDAKVVDNQRLWKIDTSSLPEFGSAGLAQAVKARSGDLLMMAVDIYIDLSRHQINRQTEVERQQRRRKQRLKGKLPKHRVKVENITIFNPLDEAHRPSAALFDYQTDEYLMTAGNTGDDMEVRYDANPGPGRSMDAWSNPDPDLIVYTTRMPEGHFFELRLRSRELDQDTLATSMPKSISNAFRDIKRKEFEKQQQEKELRLEQSMTGVKSVSAVDKSRTRQQQRLDQSKRSPR